MGQTRIIICAAIATAAAASPLATQGELGLLQPGVYVCALPGTAAGSAWVEEPSRNFTVTGSSSYTSGGAGGTYLLEGRKLSFTRGPLKGLVMTVTGSGLLQEVEAGGKMGRLRCHRAHRGD